MADTALATQDGTYQDDSAAVQMSRADYGRLSVEDLALVLRLHSEGRTQRQIAAVIGCSQPAIHYTLQRFNLSQQDAQALMKAHSLEFIEDWKRASKKAADRGDHRPAREGLEAGTPELRPQPANSGAGGGVTINIGMPGQPVALPVIEVCAQPLSPVRSALPSETPQER